MKTQFAAWRQTMSLRDVPQFRFFLILNLWLVSISGIWLVLSELSLPGELWIGFEGLLRLQDKPASVVTIILIVTAWCLMPCCSEAKLKHLLHYINQYIYLIVTASFIAYALLAYFVYLRYPLSMDEYCLVFQSQVFASGKLAGQIPPDLLDYYVLRRFHASFFVLNHQQGWILSGYWPGTSLLMAPFSLLGLTWLYNPVISSLTILALHRIVRRWSGSEEAAAWAILLTLASPVIAISAASFYSMPSHLLANLLFCGLLIRDNRKAAFGAGLIGGFAMTLHNPVPHFAFALPWMLYVFRYRRELLIPLFAGYLVFGITLGVGWVACLSWFTASETARVGHESNGIIASVPKAFAIPDASVIANRISGMVKMLLWASPGLLVVFFVAWKIRFEARFRVLAYSLASTFLIYLAVPFDQGQGWGFRYLHSAWFALPVLAGLALSTQKFSPQGLSFLEVPQEKQATRRFMALCALLSILMLMPLFAMTTHDYIKRRTSQLPSPPQDKRSILFVNTNYGEFAWDLTQNDPFLRNKNWLLVAHEPASNARIARKHLKGAKQVSYGKWGEMWVEN
jgi:hypothetical protein